MGLSNISKLHNHYFRDSKKMFQMIENVGAKPSDKGNIGPPYGQKLKSIDKCPGF
jgi:hypothetical protein